MLKKKVYDSMIKDGILEKEKIKQFSPKFFKILKNIDKYISDDDIPTGKIMYYSDFRQDAGSEIFEKILIANGYEKYDFQKNDINKLIENGDKKKRFTFISGLEGPIERKNNKEAFNHIENLRGEYIQLILISSAGAEGISLTAVRQVHIMEPYWHFGRINQVFGRAIRFKSHIDFDNEIDRTVEQYLYLSFLPEGNDIESIYQSLKDNEELWSEVRDIDITDDIKTTLLNRYPDVYNLINKTCAKTETKDEQ